jgi:hypothetical protein
MKFSPFSNCISYNGISTRASGSMVGAYDFTSGSGSAVIYNLLYPSGQNFSGNNYYGPVFPIINVGASGATGALTGLGAYRIGYEVSGDFGLVIDNVYDRCRRFTTSGSGIGYILASTASGFTTGFGTNFYLGVDEINQLYVAASGTRKTLHYELQPRNLVYLNYGNRKTVEFGVYDPQENRLTSATLTLPNSGTDTNSVYMGGILRYSADTTGFYGALKHAVLFRKPVSILEGSGCYECLYAIGSGTGAPVVTTIAVPAITGYQFSGRNESYVSGIVPITGTVTLADNSTVSVVFPSGLTGTRQAEEVASVLTGMIIITTTGLPSAFFSKSVADYYAFATYDIELKYPLASGDYLEIYTYSGYNANVGLDIYALTFPTTTGFVQLYGNGLAETNGVDYIVDTHNEISGFYDDDNLIYDIATGASLVSPFSGWWARGKVIMSGGSFYPTSAQFNETVDTGRIIITGVTGARLPASSDVYLNGQKLVSGVHYKIIDNSVSGYFGAQTGLACLVIDPSYVSDFNGYFLYHPTGGLPTGVESVDDSELTILPNYGSFIRYTEDVTGQHNIFSGITGFSEQVWLNGVRQRLNVDYFKNVPCSVISGISPEDTNTFNFFNNETGYFNIS